jgi:hypothetical protein
MQRDTERSLVEDTLRKVPERMADSPWTVGTKFDLDRDQSGESQVFVTVYLDDATDDSDWTTPKLEPVKQRVRDLISDAGADRWGYVRFRRKSDSQAA